MVYFPVSVGEPDSMRFNKKWLLICFLANSTASFSLGKPIPCDQAPTSHKSSRAMASSTTVRESNHQQYKTAKKQTEKLTDSEALAQLSLHLLNSQWDRGNLSETDQEDFLSDLTKRLKTQAPFAEPYLAVLRMQVPNEKSSVPILNYIVKAGRLGKNSAELKELNQYLLRAKFTHRQNNSRFTEDLLAYLNERVQRGDLASLNVGCDDADPLFAQNTHKYQFIPVASERGPICVCSGAAFRACAPKRDLALRQCRDFVAKLPTNTSFVVCWNCN